MANDTLGNPAPQFGKAEYQAASSGPDRCQSCKQSVGSQYYRVNGALTCAFCGEQAKLRLPKDTHEAFVRSLFFGTGGAILGLILYSAFGIITGLMIGYISLAVGYLVGKAMMKGSSGVGGRRYQIAAVLLTYAAVSMAAIPVGISQYMKQEKAKKQGLVRLTSPGDIQARRATPTDPNTTVVVPEPEAIQSADNVSRVTENPPARKPKLGIGAAFAMLALAGLASPFLELADPLHGVIGLVILFVGVRIAWKITQGVQHEVVGPFSQSPERDGAS
jgi:hypothetical protein